MSHWSRSSESSKLILNSLTTKRKEMLVGSGVVLAGLDLLEEVALEEELWSLCLCGLCEEPEPEPVWALQYLLWDC